ncbi:MAG TPA: hypothetical protein DCX53_10405 [Anaerolineae bacterium]|nr:hypothetical protein [Anaerolineae bacterium]
MNQNNDPQKTKRMVLTVSGLFDALIGAGILLVGFGFFPVDIAEFGIPQWVILVVGGTMFIAGTWMAVHNYSRLNE